MTTLFSQLASAFSLGSATSPLDGAAAYSAFENVFQGGVPWINSSIWDPTAPKAYLNYLLFDENFVLVDAGFDQVSTDCEQESDLNPVAPHDYLSLHVKVEQKGYLYVYLSNEQPTLTNVYFDDMKIVQYSAVEQVNDYYPFGLTFNSYQRENSVENKFKFNGKEERKELGLGWLDYGVRMYMSDIGRWPKIDPKAELYFQISPYAYAANTPTNAIDPDGRLVIFINGQHGGSGGKVDYWQEKETVTRYASYSFFGQTIWSGYERREEVTADFASAVQDHFNDHSPARFYDGAIGGWANTFESTFVPQADNLSSGDRYVMGKQQGEKDAADIIHSLARTGGVITESLKVVSHSMGGAYAKGFVQAIVDYAMAHPEECRGLKISEFDFDPLQAAQLRAIAGVHTEQYTHLGNLADEKQDGLEDAQGKKDGNSYNEDPSKTDHSIMSFFNNIQNLEEGTYVFQNGEWIKQ